MVPTRVHNSPFVRCSIRPRRSCLFWTNFKSLRSPQQQEGRSFGWASPAMASTKLVVLIAALPLFYALNWAYRIGKNYLAVRHTKLPVLVNPLNIASLEWTFGKTFLIAIW